MGLQDDDRPLFSDDEADVAVDNNADDDDDEDDYCPGMPEEASEKPQKPDWEQLAGQKLLDLTGSQVALTLSYSVSLSVTMSL